MPFTAPEQDIDEPKSKGFIAPVADVEPITKAAPTTKTGRLESAVRGLSQGATFGFGDELQAALRAISPTQLEPTNIGGVTVPLPGWNQDFGEYSKLRDEQRVDNKQAAKDNPLSYFGGSLAGAAVGGAPLGITALGKTALGLTGTAARSAGIGAAQGLGAGEGDFSDQAASTIEGAGIQALTGRLAAGVAPLTGSIVTAAGKAGATEAGKTLVHAGVNSGAAGLIAATTGGNVPAAMGMGALSGLAPGLRNNYVDRATKRFVNAISQRQQVVDTRGERRSSNDPTYTGRENRLGTRVTNKLVPSTSTLVQALRQMSGQDAEKITAQVEPAIQRKIQQGVPSYAARFSALQNSPEYRVAHQRVLDEAEEDQED